MSSDIVNTAFSMRAWSNAIIGTIMGICIICSGLSFLSTIFTQNKNDNRDTFTKVKEPLLGSLFLFLFGGVFLFFSISSMKAYSENNDIAVETGAMNFLMNRRR
jgi:Mn2+/Fe2+ NRAMP family transporter